MIYCLITEGHTYTVRRFLKRWGKPVASRVRLVTYEQTRCYLRGGSLARRRTRGALRRVVNAYYEAREAPRAANDLPTPPAGHWIFADIERLTAGQREEAARFRDVLVARGAATSVHNDPLATMGRYELLRTLHQAGINDFDVYRLTEARRPQRYPVFLRTESDHSGAESGLLETPEALDVAIADLDRDGKARDGRLAIEYRAERDARGLFRKYSAWCIGGEVIPGHLFFSPDWMVKEPKVVDDEALREEEAYLHDNPHASALAEVFRLGRVGYGRADYGVVDGRVQIYEVNTNPGIPSSPAPGPGALRVRIDEMFNERILDSLRSLDGA